MRSTERPSIDPAVYAEPACGMPEYWLVDPKNEPIPILRLVQDAYAVHGRFCRGATAASAIYPQLTAEVAAVCNAA